MNNLVGLLPYINKLSIAPVTVMAYAIEFIISVPSDNAFVTGVKVICFFNDEVIVYDSSLKNS